VVDRKLLLRKLAELELYLRQVAMVRMTGFRNVLVHEYATVNPEIVVRILRDHLVDLQRFGAAAKQWV